MSDEIRHMSFIDPMCGCPDLGSVTMLVYPVLLLGEIEPSVTTYLLS